MTATGAFVGNDPSDLAAFSKWMGTAPDNVLVQLNQSGWDAFDSSVGWFAGRWQGVSSRPIYGVPLTVSGTSLESVASGAFNSHYLAAAKTLAATDRHDGKPMYIRLGWEFNGDWMPWAAKGHEAAYVKAFQQIVDTFRSVSNNFKFVWDVNIGGNNMNPETVYPGDKYVDVIGTDVYWNTKWDTKDPNAAFAEKVSGGWGGYGLQWQQDFAKAHGKATAISEWGVMSDNAGDYLHKMAAWMKDHGMVYENYWDNNSDFFGMLHQNQYPTAGAVFRDEFDNLGGSSTPVPTTPTTPTKPPTTTPTNPTTPTTGSGGGSSGGGTSGGGSSSGADTLVLTVSADAYAGNPHFKVMVDGKQVGAVQVASADHGDGKSQDIVLKGSFGKGAHDVSVEFVDDYYGGSSATDRNLYVHQVSLNGKTMAGDKATTFAGNVAVDDGVSAMYGNSTVGFHLPGSGTSGTKPSTGSGGSSGGGSSPTQPTTQDKNTLVLQVSEDSYGGHAQFIVKVDGQQVGGVQTAHASHDQGKSDQLTLTGNFSAQPGQIDVQFLNDLWGGTAATDRNLYVDKVTVGNHDYVASSGDKSADLYANGTASFHRAA